MVHEPSTDSDLVMLDANHLFEPSTTRVGFRRGSYLRGFMYEFLELFTPHLTRDVVDTARKLKSRTAREALFVDQKLEMR